MNKEAVIIKQQIKKKIACQHYHHVRARTHTHTFCCCSCDCRAKAGQMHRLQANCLQTCSGSQWPLSDVCRYVRAYLYIWEQVLISSSRERCPEETVQDVFNKNISIHTLFFFFFN